MKRLIAALLTALLLLLPAASAAGFVNDTGAINEACRSVMKLEVRGGRGGTLGTASGFVAFDDRTLVTACHVIADAHTIIATSDTGEEYEIVSVLAADSDSDIAILRFEAPTGLTPLPLLMDGKVFRGSPVAVIGSPKGMSNNVSRGNVSSVYTGEDGIGRIRFSAPISAGSSGGVVLNDDGVVIGITVGYYTEGQNLNEAVEIAKAIELYEAHRDDEPVALTGWSEIDTGSGENDVPAVRSFTIRDDASFSISEVYLYADSAASWGKARNTSGWLYKGQSMEFTVTDEEANALCFWTLNFCFYLNGRPYYTESSGWLMSEILGHTLSVTIEGNYVNVDIVD